MSNFFFAKQRRTIERRPPQYRDRIRLKSRRLAGLSARQKRRPPELRPVKQGLTIMIILGLFLIHLAVFVATFAFIEWLVGWLGGATITEAVLMFMAAFVAAATIRFLIANRRGGVIVAVAIIAFWAFLIFGAARATAINILALAAAALVAATAVVLAESFVVRRGAARNPR
jgi:hypothetical protein